MARRYDQAAAGISRTIEHDSITAAVWVPLLRAGVTGCACAALAWLSAWGLAYDRDTWGIAGFVGVGAFLAAWVNLIYHRGRDSMPPSMPTPPAGRLLPIIAPGRNPETTARNAKQDRFRVFVLACGHSTARRDLLRDFSESELAEFRGVLYRLGYAQDRGADPRQGWQLVEPPAVILAEIEL